MSKIVALIALEGGILVGTLLDVGLRSLVGVDLACLVEIELIRC